MIEVLELRKALGWTQEHFSRVIGCSRQCVISWEKHKYFPSPIAQVRIRQVIRKYGLESLFGHAQHRSAIRVHRVNPIKMNAHVNEKAYGWPKWPMRKRLAYRGNRARYLKMLQDQELGRAIILPAKSSGISKQSAPDPQVNRAKPKNTRTNSTE